MLIFNCSKKTESVILSAGKYHADVWGAQGGDCIEFYTFGGNGVYTSATFTLDKQTKISIIVGRKGESNPGGTNAGGGGSYIFYGSNLICAAGGGGVLELNLDALENPQEMAHLFIHQEESMEKEEMQDNKEILQAQEEQDFFLMAKFIQLTSIKVANAHSMEVMEEQEIQCYHTARMVDLEEGVHHMHMIALVVRVDQLLLVSKKEAEEDHLQQNQAKLIPDHQHMVDLEMDQSKLLVILFEQGNQHNT